MSALVPVRQNGPPTTAGATTFGRVLASERTKLTTLRTSWLIAGIFVILSAGVGILIATQAATSANVADRDPVQTLVDVVTQPTIFTQLILGVFGALIMSTEYSTGTIQTTLLTVPRRVPVLTAKALTVIIATIGLSLVSSVVALAVAYPILQGSALATDPFNVTVIRAVVGTAVHLAVTALFAAMVGALVRNPAAAITILIATLFVVPVGLEFFKLSWNPVQYLLGLGASGVDKAIATGSSGPQLFEALLATVCWIGLPAVIAAVLLKKRDA